MQKILEQALALGRQAASKGHVATYIPELGKVDGSQLGVSIFSITGERISLGDTQVRFSIQSISKIFSLAAALDVCGPEKVFANVGMEPSGDPFNSLIKLENTSSTPYNPMINAGAMVVISYLVETLPFEQMLALVRRLCLDDEIVLDEKVYASEMSNISRNRAIAYLLESKGYIGKDVESVLDYYVRMCSLSVTAESLAAMALVLANDGIQPKTGERLLSSRTVKTVKTIMLTCGMYDGSGEFAVRVGIPSKSGVGGGVLSVVDRELGIGIFGPALDGKGNSVAGECVLEYLSQALHIHMFDNRRR